MFVGGIVIVVFNFFKAIPRSKTSADKKKVSIVEVMSLARKFTLKKKKRIDTTNEID